MKKKPKLTFARRFYRLSLGLLVASGMIWLASRYLLEGREGMGDWALNSQYWALKLHGAGMFLFLLALGYSAPQMAKAWKARRKHKLELSWLLLLGLAALSGWLINYGPSGTAQDQVSMAHWILGLVALAVLLVLRADRN